MAGDAKVVEAPEPLPPGEHEKAEALNEARRALLKGETEPTSDADLPKVHSDDG